MNATLQPPVQRYLERLELELKKHAGVTPEDALSDAREFLQNDRDSLLRAEPGLDDEAVYAHFVETFGTPENVARSYAESETPLPRCIPGYAPGWRACCTKCGRSAPAAKLGITRIGAWSHHKYTLTWCRGCRGIRFIRIIRDGNQTNLTKQLGVDRTAADVRRSMHRPWPGMIVIAAIGIVAACVLALQSVSAFFAASGDRPAIFEQLPDDWTVQKSFTVPANQRDAIGQRLGGKLTSLSNTIVMKQGQPLQINTVECADDESAVRVESALRQGKSNRRLVQRRGRTIYELVARNGNQLRMAFAARYELGIQPPRVKYQVRFDAAPVKSGDSTQWNRMFNLFLRLERNESPDAARRQIDELSKHFEFDDRLLLRSHGLGDHASEWSFDPQPGRSSRTDGGEISVYEFTNLPRRAGLPLVSVTGTVTSETGGVIPTKRNADNRLTEATSYWPVNDPTIRQLAAKITAGSKSSRDKVKALLQWSAPGSNLRYDGPIVGSRYGVTQVLEQKFGHCWDFSDVFVTLCRASGVPCRQVMGWLHDSEGHVWAEVLIDGEGWKQVDATAMSGCGSDYIPFVASEDGTMPLLYLSSVRVEVLSTSGNAP